MAYVILVLIGGWVMIALKENYEVKASIQRQAQDKAKAEQEAKAKADLKAKLQIKERALAEAQAELASIKKQGLTSEKEPEKATELDNNISKLEKQVAQLRESTNALASQRIDLDHQISVSIRKASSIPEMVQKGAEVHVLMDYDVMVPNGVPGAQVTESWILRKDGRILAEIPEPSAFRTPGGWTTTATITIPKNASPGTYIVEHKVQTGTSHDSAKSSFTVEP